MRFGGRGKAGAGRLLPWAALLLLCVTVTTAERKRREPKWW